MVASKKDDSEGPRRPPATTPQGRENQLTALAYDVAEKQMRSGTASAQVITHFLKMGAAREQLERTRLEHEIELAKAKVDQLGSSAKIEELYEKAITAFTGYQPSGDDDFE